MDLVAKLFAFTVLAILGCSSVTQNHSGCPQSTDKQQKIIPERKYPGPCRASEISETFTIYDHDRRLKIAGQTKATFTTTYTYDEKFDNRLLSVEREGQTFEGPRYSLRELEYDSRGNLIIEKVTWLGPLRVAEDEENNDPEGETTWVRELELWKVIHNKYDSSDRRISQEIDVLGDGTIEQRHDYTYDANGRLVTHEWDYKRDGSEDLGDYLFGEIDKRLPDAFTEQSRRDRVQRVHYLYHETGDLVGEHVDVGADGTIDYKNTYTYSKRENWLWIQKENNSDRDRGVSENVYFDPNGNKIKHQKEFTPFDDDSKYRIVWYYDTFGNLLMKVEHEDTADDGIVTIYNYDCFLLRAQGNA